MKLIKIILVLCLSVFTIPHAIAEDMADEKVFSGTVEISTTQMAFFISGQKGGGTLEFEGDEYAFKLIGLGVGGLGIQKANAVGAVYNLDKIEDFNGKYILGRAGVTVGKGKGGISLTNVKTGVVMDLKSSAKGAALTLGVDGISISIINY